ncbi:YbaB/EbfC family nucleoid-associated protein [Aquihabitans sp. McL0605]|uniref:YbaB/EbfC family nucleoid-associated protein n=1 Tax=Aquihabitans sp. McL0605 TaxID=3415671 RepID=UPI003CF69C27
MSNDPDHDDAISADAIDFPAASPPGDDPLAALLGGGGPGGFDFGVLMEQAGQVQAQLMAAQEAAASTVVEGVAGGGAVRVAVTGSFEFQSVTIAPEAVDPDDVDMLQDLILAALRDAVDEIQGLQQGGLSLGDIDLGGLLGGS